MKTLFRSEKKLFNEHIGNVPKEVIERNFILDFFSVLPLEKLKEIVSFKSIDPKDEKLWQDAREIKFLREELFELRNQNMIKYTCKINI